MAHPLDPKDATAALDELRLSGDRRLASIGLTVLLLAGIWFIRADLELFASDWWLLRDRLILRSLLILVPLLGLVAIRFAESRRAYSLTALLVAGAIGVLLFTIVAIRPAGSGMPLRLPLLVLAVSYFALPNSRGRQIGPPVMASAGLAVLRVTWLSEGGAVPEVDVVAIAALNAIGIVTILRRLQLEGATAAAVGRLHALHSVIPICAHCRKVHSDLGGWQPLDRYVLDRSEARFSPGVCPDCARAHDRA